MTFSLINTWSVGDSFTSAQANSIAIAITDALDKTTAGDQLAGALTMASTASITAGYASQIVGSAAGAIATTAQGGIELGGGANDFPTFSATRSRVVLVSIADSPQIVGSTTIVVGTGGVENTSSASSPSSFWLPVTHRMHNGATLDHVVITFKVGLSHTGVPANMPTITVQRVDGSGNISNLKSTAGQMGSPATGALWYASGAAQNYSYVCDQNNVIDTANYTYNVFILDEYGANAMNDNLWISATIVFTTIPDMKFP
jgi:hypothetical protein